MSPSGDPSYDEVERLYLAGSEGAALDRAAALLAGYVSIEMMASLQHEWPARLERMHPAALDADRQKRWVSVARQGIREPSLPAWKLEPPLGIVDFPVLGRGGTSARIVRVQVDTHDDRQDRLPAAKQITRAARGAIQAALRAARALLPRKVCFLVTLPDLGVPIDEESLGLPVAVAAISAALKWGVAERFCITGCISEDGRVGEVSGLPQKQRLIAAERPLATLLDPAEVPTLMRAVVQVFAENLAGGRALYRRLLREEVQKEDLSRYRRVGLTTGDPEELRKIFVEPELLPDASDKEWRAQERKLAAAIDEHGIPTVEKEARRQAYRAWVGRDFHRDSSGTNERLRWAPIYENHRALIVCGELGMGKTTLLARLALDGLSESDDEPEGDQRPARPLPVLVSACDFSRQRDSSLIEFMKRVVQERWSDAPYAAVAALVSAFHDGQVLLFIDALNEAADEDRQRLLQCLVTWRATRGDVRCVITTRASALTTVNVPPGFRTFMLAGLTEAQAYQMMARGKPDHDAEVWNTLRFIRSQPALREIAANPLLLMLTSRLSMEEIEKLHHWVDVYERTMPLILRGPRAVPLPTPELRRQIQAWSAVANHLQLRGEVVLREYDARHLLGQHIGLSGDARDRKLDRLLAVALEHGGLLVRRGRHDLSFWHPSFQEYLAAIKWSEQIPCDASVTQLIDHWRQLVARRDNHETLRLALGRMAFHLGSAQRRLAIDLVSRIAETAHRDSLLDGAWLCLAADVCLDGVPVSPQVRERLVKRLVERTGRFDDVPAAERLTRLASSLLTNEAPSSPICESLARLLEHPEQVASEALTSAMQLLAAAASSDCTAREACRRMYERLRPADDKPPKSFLGGWATSILPIAALGLLRAGIVPSGLAIQLLAPLESLRTSWHIQPGVFEAIRKNPVAIETAVRPFLQDGDADVRASARCLYAIACPLSAETQDWMRQCIEKRDYAGTWFRKACTLDAEIPGQLLRLAAAVDRDVVIGLLQQFVEEGIDSQSLCSQFVPWLLAQPFSTDLVNKLRLRTVTTPEAHAQVFHRELSRRLEEIAGSDTAPEAERAAAWLTILFAVPKTKAQREAWFRRLGECAAAVPPADAKEWLSLFVSLEQNELAGTLASRVIRDADSAALAPLIQIISNMDLPRWWPPSVFVAVNERALAAANDGRADEVLSFALLTGDHKLEGVMQALEIIGASSTGLPAWKAGFWLLRGRRMNRDIAISMLRQIDAIDDDHFWHKVHLLSAWIYEHCLDDEAVLRALVDALIRAQDLRLRSLDETLAKAIAARPERVDLLIEKLRTTEGTERQRTCGLLSSVCGRSGEHDAGVRQRVGASVADPDIGPEVVFALANYDVPTEPHVRAALRTLAQRKDEQGRHATSLLRAWGEELPEHWSTVEARLASQDFDEVLDAACEMLRAQRKSAMLVENLRRCLSGPPVLALRAALVLYGIEEPIADAVSKLFECLRIHAKQRFLESAFIVSRRQRHGVHRRARLHIGSSADLGPPSEPQSSPPPTGRERFRPDFWSRDSAAECAACLLAEVECRAVIPTLIEWLHGDRSALACSLLRFLSAESEPDFSDWLLERVHHGDYWVSDSASEALIEANVAPERHITALLARLADKDPVKRWTTGIRILVLCAKRADCARTAEQALGTLAPETAWLVARWLIGVGRSSQAIAKAYVEGEFIHNHHSPHDWLTFRVRTEEEKKEEDADWLLLFDENRLHADELVLREFGTRLSEGTPTERAKKAERVLGWLQFDDDLPLLSGPLSEPLREVWVAGLGSDDIGVRSFAIDSIDRFGSFDESVAAAAISCLHEEFGEGASRPIWGEFYSRDDWEMSSRWQSLDVARILIRRGLKPEPIQMLTRIFERGQAAGSFDEGFLLKVGKLLLGCGEVELARRMFVYEVSHGRMRLYQFQDLFPFLQRSEAPEPLIRAAVLNQFAHDNSFSAYLIRQWARGVPVYAECEDARTSQIDVHREFRNELPYHPTALDRRTVRLKWLAAQNLPSALLCPAMILLAMRYDEARATQLELALMRRADAAAEVEVLLSRDESDGEGPRLAKAWLIASLTD